MSNCVEMSRVFSRRGLARGALSRPFHASDLLEALPTTINTQVVYAEVDAEGRMVPAGGGGDGGGAAAARLAAGARLAPHVAARTGTLERAPLGALRLRLDCDLPPHQEIALWFDEELLALLDMPFLALRNIRGRDDYACHECNARFESPNPLKVHLFLSCAPYEPVAFWREFASRTASTLSTRPPLDIPDPAQLEALATEWGRAQGGHLCVYCGKMYSRKYGLKIHIRTHTGYRPLRCRYCLRAFGDPSNLNKHVRLHAGVHLATSATGAGARACSSCGKVVARRRDLERHARTHAPVGR